jgi:hypothetical protein
MEAVFGYFSRAGFLQYYVDTRYSHRMGVTEPRPWYDRLVNKQEF